MTADPIEIRALRSDEARKLVDCVRRCYGETYVDPGQYDADRIAREIAEGRRHALVAISDSGAVIGHMGITLRRRGDITADAGMTLVDPAHRGRGISHQLGAAIARTGRALGLVGAHDYPVTVHGATQRIGADHGFDTGLLLDNMPADVAFEEMERTAGASRSASLIRYLPLSPAPERTLYVPQRYEAIVRWLCARARLPRELATAREHAPASASEIAVREDDRRDVQRIALVTPGVNAIADITSLLRDGPGAPATSQIDLPLGDPAIPAIAEALWERGFFYGGLLPEYRDGDVLRLQRPAAPASARPAPVLESETARALCRFLLRDAADPREPAPAR